MSRIFSELRENWKSLLYCFFIVATFFPRRHIFNLADASSTGWFIDAFSISLYAADFVCFAIFLVNYRTIIGAVRRHFFLLAAFLFLLFAESVYLNNTLLALYFSLRIIQFFILLYLLLNWIKEKRGFYFFLYTVAILAALQSFIGIFQYVYGHSLGLGFLGESILATNMPGVAKIAIGQGNRILRAYGTLPHPNILGGFLLSAIAGITYAGIRYGKLNKTLKILLFIIFIGLLTTFSRTAILSAIFLLLYVRFRTNQNSLIFRLVFLLLILFVVFACVAPVLIPMENIDTSRTIISFADNSFSDRILLSKNAVLSIGKNSLTGTGSGQYILQLIKNHPIGTSLEKWQYDYPHNVFLTIIAEFGITGIFAFSYIVYKILGQKAKIIIITAAILIPIILFDHYLWTQQTGRIIFVLLLILFINLVSDIESKRLVQKN